MTNHHSHLDEQTEKPTPMFPWPNCLSIRNILMDRVEEEAQSRLSGEARYEPILDSSQQDLSAPGLQDAVLQAIGDYNMPGRLLDRLDGEQDLCADKAVELLPPDQFEQMVQATMEALSKQALSKQDDPK